ncbi:hypothetical protein D3C80_2199390 [compost metagenome]
MREQVVVTDERRDCIGLAIAQVTHGHRLQRHLGIDGAGQQATVESAQAAAIGGGAFRKDQQRAGLLQVLADLFAQ